MKDTTIRRLLVGGNEDDFKVGAALIAKRGLVKESIYAFEDVNIWTEKMHLDKVQYLQNKYPTIIVTGSVALFLHGCRVDRWYRNGISDIDLVLPYFIPLNDEKIEINLQYEHGGSGSDFQEVYLFDGIKLDTRVNPNQRYELITYDGYTYRVSDPLDIIQAKIKYAKQSGSSALKHREDLYDIIGKTTFATYMEKISGLNKEISF